MDTLIQFSFVVAAALFVLPAPVVPPCSVLAGLVGWLLSLLLLCLPPWPPLSPSVSPSTEEAAYGEGNAAVAVAFK